RATGWCRCWNGSRCGTSRLSRRPRVLEGLSCTSWKVIRVHGESGDVQKRPVLGMGVLRASATTLSNDFSPLRLSCRSPLGRRTTVRLLRLHVERGRLVSSFWCSRRLYCRMSRVYPLQSVHQAVYPGNLARGFGQL